HGLELAGLDGQARAPQLADDAIDEPARELRRLRIVERRPPSLAAVGGERELRNDQDGTADVLDRAIHVLRRVERFLEDAQTADFSRDVDGIRFGVSALGPDEREKAGADPADGAIADAHACGRDALNDGPHARTRGRNLSLG